MDKVKVLVTGSEGFIGKNLIHRLKALGEYEIFPFDVNTAEELLDKYCCECSFVFHLAGVNRPQNASEFMEGNFGFTTKLLKKLEAANNKSPVLLSSSIQASLDNDYGKSKKAGEDYLIDYGIKNNVFTYIFRLPNVFGKWCRPNYNSAIATFCHNIARGLPIQIYNRDAILTLVYIDDVVEAFLSAIKGDVTQVDGFATVDVKYEATIGYIVELLHGFVLSRKNLFCPLQSNNSFEKKLYSTYISYLPKDDFSYSLNMHFNESGSFTEILKTLDYGQVSVNISKPGVTKGNHWHNTKNEKFLIVSGEGVIRFRKVDEHEIIEYHVNGDKFQIIDIPCGYTHNIENLGDSNLVTIMWANEIYDKDNPDTFYLEV